MPYQRIKFYQTGSFAVGNRLLTEDQRSVQSTADRSNALTCGHRACQGCGEALGARYALDAVYRATGGKMIAVNATGCLEVFSTPFPETSWQIAWLHSLFGNAPAVASGVAAALKARGRADIRVVGQGGDGGTVDIGFACLSGMFERNDDVLYICYDNQAYMNTGVQRSGATPPAVRTAATQAVGREPGNRFGQGKNVPLIAMAHEIPYVATATVADLRDLEYKATRAMDFRGAATCTSWSPARSAGAAPRPTRSRSPGWPPKAACSRCSKPRPARRPAPPRSATRCRSPTTCASRPGTRTCSNQKKRPTSSGASRRPPTATSAGSGWPHLVPNGPRLLYQERNEDT
jgi:pyruvate ferredoxin oxidoreductase beta subunit